MATASRNAISFCNCDHPNQKVNENCEVICDKCDRRVSIEKAKWCFCDQDDFRTFTVAPEGLYITCNECNSHRFFANTEDISKPLPKICRCGKVESYETIQRTGRTLALCRTCCILAEVKLSEDHSHFELWGADHCPSCQADVVRFSSDDPKSNSYICDDCGIRFKVKKTDQKNFETDFGQPKFLQQINDPRSLHQGDLIVVGDKCSQNLCFVMDIDDFSIFIVKNDLHTDFISLSTIASRIYRVEYLPHDRYSSGDALDGARSAIQNPFPGNFTGILKAGREIQSEELQNLPVKDSVIVEGCKGCGESFCRSSIQEFRDGEIVLCCSACENRYSVPDTREFRTKLSSGNYGESCQRKRVTKISQLGNGDLISFKRLGYSHHALCTKVDKKSGLVDVIDFNFDKISWAPRIVERKNLSFKDDIAADSVTVFRFMPLDCLPIDRVLSRAFKLALNPSLQETYNAFRNNCQHFASWCKTDQAKSEEGSLYRKVYGYASVAADVLSIFVPGVRWIRRGFLLMESTFRILGKVFEPPRPTENYDGMSLPPVAKEPGALNSAAALARAGLKTALFFI